MPIIEEIMRFSGGMEDWKGEEDVEKGYMRRVDFRTAIIGGDSVTCILLSNYDRKTDKVLSAAEFRGNHSNLEPTNWALVNQERAISWQAKMLLIQGTRVKMGGFMGEYAASGETQNEMTYAEQINFGFVGSAASGVGTFVYQPGHGFSTGQWVTRTPDGFVLAQPNDPILRETMGMVTLVIGNAADEVLESNSFIVESFGYGADPYYTGIEWIWGYLPGQEIYLAADGGVTDVKPSGIPYRSLGTVWDYGYFHINQRTVYPTSYQPELTEWPTDSQLRAAIGEGGFRVFYYLGAEPGLVIGCYLNQNAGNPAETPISTPTKL
jgi:hypothetical protein